VVASAGLGASAALALLTALAVPLAVSGEPVPPLRRPPAARIAVAGDTGTGDRAQQTTVRRMVEQARVEPYDAVVLLASSSTRTARRS
jgi:pantoate kinase